MERKKVDGPDLELTEEAATRLAKMAAPDHHPSAAAANAARAKRVARERLERAAARRGPAPA